MPLKNFALPQTLATLVGALALPLAALPAYAQPFERTVVVTGEQAPAVNGANLLNELANLIPMAGPNARWLILVEPGDFDIGNSTLVMGNFIDIQGSGRNSTHIRSSAPVAVSAPAGIDAEIRDLTVISRSQNNTTQTGIQISTPDFKVTTVNVDVFAARAGTAISIVGSGRPRINVARVTVEAGTEAVGLSIGSNSPFLRPRGGVILNEIFIRILSQGSRNIGIRASFTTEESILEGAAGVIGLAEENYGFQLLESTARISNSVMEVFGNRTVQGISSISSQTFVKGTTIKVGGGNAPVGIFNRGGELFLQSYVGQPTAQGPTGLGLQMVSGRVEVNQSVIEQRVSVEFLGGTLRVGSSKLTAPRNIPGGSDAQCIFSYEDDFVTAVPPGCN